MDRFKVIIVEDVPLELKGTLGIIKNDIPEAEIIDYVTKLKSLTQASGFFNREFEGYEELPEFLKDKVIAENKVE